MSGGISALEGFDYQATVALELMLGHFDAHGASAQARPEGKDDLDLIHEEGGVTLREFVQIKKPRQDADGLRAPSPWSLRDAIEALLAPRWNELQDERTRLRWILGDALGGDSAALWGDGSVTSVWAARRAAAEWVVRDRRLAPLPAADHAVPEWRSPFRGDGLAAGTPEDARVRWTESFTRRATRAGFDAATIAAWITAAEQAHDVLDHTLDRVRTVAPFAEATDLRARVTTLLAVRFGLNEADVRHVVFRNLRGFIDDVARARGKWIDLPTLEQEIVHVWPLRLATVLPPPLPSPHLPRPRWVRELAGRTGAVIGPSGAGKTTSATELYQHLRDVEPATAVLYAEVRSDTAWRSVLEGVAHAVGRRGGTAPYALLPSIRAGHDEALLKMADALNAVAIPVALLVDLVDGTASAAFERDLARFVQRLPAKPKLRLWVFGQEDGLAQLADVERATRRLLRVPAAGLDWEEFLAFSSLHGLQGRSELHPVYDALTSGRTTGVPPRVADAVLRLGSVPAALTAARSADVLLEADRARYERLQEGAQAALGALACLTHPFGVEEAETAFPALPVKLGIRAGIRAGLIHPLSDGRTEFHETVRRNVLAQQARAVAASHHALLAEVYAASGDRVLEAHHAEQAGLGERARVAGRAAFFDRNTANRVGARAAGRGWVSPAEVLVLLRGEPNGPYAWWEALHAGMDDGTAEALLSWWREVLRQTQSHQAQWSAPAALVAARPDFLPGLLDIVADTPGEGGHHHGAAALGHALRRSECDEALVLARFERATGPERPALAEVLAASHRPQCLARWLAHVVETDSAPRMLPNVALSDAHVEAIVDALPAREPAQLVVEQDWGFGAATPFLWKHRDAVGAGAARLLEDDGLLPKRASVALRLLGVTGHEGLMRAARIWARRPGRCESVALAGPLLVDEDAWREELARLSLDPSNDKSTRIAAFGMYVQSGEHGAELLNEIAAVSPDIEKVCRFTAGLTFIMRPSIFSLDLLLEGLTQDNSDGTRRVSGTALARAAHFADGPHAAAVAERLVPLLDIPSPDVRLPVLHALTALRQPYALRPCAKLALEEGGSPVGGAAAVAACASRPRCLSDVRAALDANPGQRWLVAALSARLWDTGAIADLLADAEDAAQHWAVRRRSLLAVERLPIVPEACTGIASILRERPLLGAHDAVNGQLSEMLGGLLQDDTDLIANLWRRGEATFVDVLSSAVKEQDLIGVRATPQQTDVCLRVVWEAIDAGVAAGGRGGEVLSAVLNDIQRLQVQAAALGVARNLGRADILERVMATSDSPWLVLRALLERRRLDPRTPGDAARWGRLVAEGVCRDAALQVVVPNVLQPLLTPATRPRPNVGTPGSTPILSAGALHALIDAEQKAPQHARIAEMDNDALALLVARLDPDDDHVVSDGEVSDDSARVFLTTDGVTLRAPGTRHTGRKGDRAGLRARLVARFPDRVPTKWVDSQSRGHDFMSALLVALVDEGDPKRALSVLRRLSGNVTDVVNPRSNFGHLGKIADDALVEWASRLAGIGGAVEVEALAAFARHAAADAVLPLLWRLMRRVEGRFSGNDAVIPGEAHDPWRLAFTDLLHAKRLPDVPGAGAWLARMLMKVRHAYTRGWILEAMAAFPSMWSVVEADVLRRSEYGGRDRPDFREADEIAHALFQATRGGGDAAAGA